jgi:WhiB family redox-sensing transcriptional regulator
MAEMLRDGRTLDEVSEVYDLAVSTIGQYLSAAGWSGVTGQPVRRAEPVPRTIPKFTLVFAEQPWTDQAACAETDKDVFFHPERERGQARRSRDIAAKKVCARCFVAAECLDYSLTTGDVYGVFGGLTAEERHILDPSLVNHRSSPHAKTWEPDFDDERTAS